jgi:hypothetical protein
MPLDIHLATGHAKSMGCILLVVQLMTETATTPPQTPIIMLVATPSLTTLGVLDKDDKPGIFLANIWDTSVVIFFGPNFDPKIAHCPLLAAILHNPEPDSSGLLGHDANPISIPEGKLEGSTATIDPSHTTYQAFLLPKICTPPIGLAWPLNIGFDAFVDNIVVLGKSCKPFLLCIKALTPALTAWFFSSPGPI